MIDRERLRTYLGRKRTRRFAGVAGGQVALFVPIERDDDVIDHVHGAHRKRFTETNLTPRSASKVTWGERRGWLAKKEAWPDSTHRAIRTQHTQGGLVISVSPGRSSRACSRA